MLRAVLIFSRPIPKQHPEMLELNSFCIWLLVAILISVGENNMTSTSSTTPNVTTNALTISTTLSTSTTPRVSMNETVTCASDPSILCTVCKYLIGLEPILVFGIGIGGLVFLIASAVIIAVCCDRKLRKRKQPAASDHPTEANKEATSSENPVHRGSEHPYYNESATAASNHHRHSESKEAMPPYSTVYELARQVPGEHLNAADAIEICPYAEVSRDQKMRPNHSNTADYSTEYADTASVQRDVKRLPATGGYEEVVGQNGADSNRAMQWEENNPYEGALPVDAGAMEQRETGSRGGGEAIRMQNCRLPPLEMDTTLIDNFIYSNAAVLQQRF